MTAPAFLIRPAKPEDAPALLALYAPYVEQTAITFEYEVPTLAEFRQRMAQVQARYPYLVAESHGDMLGYAYAGPFKSRAAYDWAVETSIYVAMSAHRRGVGRALYQALETCLRAQGIVNVNACIAVPEQEDETLTLNSVRFHQAMGYQPVGVFHQCGYKFDRWYHMMWMEKMLAAHTVPQPPVKPFDAAAAARILQEMQP